MYEIAWLKALQEEHYGIFADFWPALKIVGNVFQKQLMKIESKNNSWFFSNGESGKKLFTVEYENDVELA